ncbi:DUF6302 family protein [Streptomyces sp. ESR1.13]|uniref:DUF6302 family protein n=1 Tax=unclassified Streptomyces TaxID=2593676 RepID=UPI004041D189
MAGLTHRIPAKAKQTDQIDHLSRAEHEGVVLRERLADPNLVDWAVEITLGNDETAETCLAVPLGGQRVAGQITVKGWNQALLALLALDGKTGFPNLRDAGSGEAAIDTPRTIRWGLETGFAQPDQRARMWGYHAAGRRSYEAEQNRDDDRVPVTPLPDVRPGPTVAGIYDVLLGGSDSYLADRHFVSSLPKADATALSLAAAINRLHMRSVIGHLTTRGIDQFLDLGCGLVPWPSPSPDEADPYTNLQDIVAQHQSTARLVYADYEGRAFAVSRITVEEHPLRPEWVQGDIRHMERFLTSGRIQHVLDWSRPVGVLLHDVLPWIGSHKTVSEAMAVLRAMLPSGSAVSITHAADIAPNNMSRFAAPFEAAGITFRARDAAGIKELFGNWPLEPPGLVPPHRWHQVHPHADLDPHVAGALAGLAFKP